MEKWCLVSTLGTSLLTNGAEDSLRRLLVRLANEHESELSGEDRDTIDQRMMSVKQSLERADFQSWRKASAEMNGILAYADRKGRMPKSEDHMVLLATDTYQGKLISDFLEEHLRQAFNCSVNVFTPRKLSTRSRYDFIRAMNEVVDWCESTIPVFQHQGYRVIFNLTGGFKSVQGYMNTLGMLYADEIVYLFEPPVNELLVIPRLPISLNFPSGDSDGRRDALVQYAVPLGLLDRIRTAPLSLFSDYNLPESFIETDNIDGTEYVCLSLWGKALWQRHKKCVLSETLFDWPYLEYTSRFKKDFTAQTDGSLRTALQDALAMISAIIMLNEGNTASIYTQASGLDYSELVNSGGIDHFRVTKGFRVSCRKTESGLELRRFGTHDDVNGIP